MLKLTKNEGNKNINKKMILVLTGWMLASFIFLPMVNASEDALNEEEGRRILEAKEEVAPASIKERELNLVEAIAVALIRSIDHQLFRCDDSRKSLYQSNEKLREALMDLVRTREALTPASED